MNTSAAVCGFGEDAGSSRERVERVANAPRSPGGRRAGGSARVTVDETLPFGR